MTNSSSMPARVSLGCAAAFILILALLHVFDAELNIGHLISEYERGRYGSLMSLAFVTLGIGSVALFLAIRHDLATRSGYVGGLWLIVVGIAYVGAAAFPPDSAAGFAVPVRATPPSFAGYVHGLCGLIVIATSPIAFTMVGRSLVSQPGWRTQVRRLRWMTLVPWFGLLSFVAALIVFGYTRSETHASALAIVLVSVSNRALILTYSAWLIVLSLSALRTIPLTTSGD
jgi:Protein of unknown function (DUF998)